MIAQDEITSRHSGLSAGKRALLEKRLAGARKEKNRPAFLSAPRRNGRVPLSFAQQRLWFLDQLEPASSLYNLPVAVRLRGPLDGDALGRAINVIVARHEILRTQFKSEDGTPVQVVTSALSVPLPVFDLTHQPEAHREIELQRLLGEEARRPFDLAQGNLMRGLLIRLGEAEHVLMVNMHHIVSDAWSLGVFFGELSTAYAALVENQEIPLPVLPVQYADYAIWQQREMQNGTLEEPLAYWRRHLAGAPPLLELPTDRPRPVTQSFRGAYAARFLPKMLGQALKQLGRDEGATLFMTLLAACKVLLFRYTGQNDIVVGSPIAGRSRIETENLIGFFVNTLALRTDLSGNLTFCQVLTRVKQTVLDGCAHPDLPFERLVGELQPERIPGCAPLVQVMFVLQNETVRGLKLPGLAAESIKVATQTAKFDLTLAVEEWPDGLLLEAEYASDLFVEDTIVRMLGHFQNLLEGIVANPSQAIGKLPLLGEPERQQVLGDWQGRPTGFPRDKSIPELFEEQVKITPEATAVVFDGIQLTYRELDRRANQLAHRLARCGVESGAMVGVCLERSPEMIVALLGVLKAGAAYVALDPNHPVERLAMMAEEAGLKIWVTRKSLFERCRLPGADAQAIYLDQPVVEPGSSEGLRMPSASSPAYVSFTSGSTGRPKGVCVPHRGVVRLVKATDYAEFNAGEIFLQLAPVSFDASTFEIWGALLNGAKLVVFPAHTPSLSELGEFIQRHGITTLWLTAGLFHQMIEEQAGNLKRVRQLLAGGDVLSPAHVKLALERLPGCRLINGYGPTENTTFTCCHHLTMADLEGRSIPIGRPIANTRVYVLDQGLQPVPIGVPGELFIGGDGLALGYVNQRKLTGEKFIPDPFGNDPAGRLYQSGDLVRWLPEGTLEFLGRKDQQVKIRGFRVEPGEIENVLGQHPLVNEAVVVAGSSQHDGKQLAAYLTLKPEAVNLKTEFKPGEIQDFLRQKLPEYMVPSVMVVLDQLPLNANGKVDRKSLPVATRHQSRLRQQCVAPRNEIERKLAGIWEEVLGVRPVGIEDRFFELGGHSLLAVRLVARIEKLFGQKIPVAAIFQAPTIAQLSVYLNDARRSVPASSIVGIQPNGTKPPLFFVHGVGGGMFWGYTNLSRHLGPDQPVYAFNSRGMAGGEEFSSIEEMAAWYVADLRHFQPAGPYLLGGYCFGGNVAFEMARQLEEQGQVVALLALMNCAPPNSSYARFRWTPVNAFKFFRNLGHWGRYVLGMSHGQRRAFFLWKIRSAQKKLARLWQGKRLHPATMDVDEVVDLSVQPEGRRNLWEAHVRALLAHQTKPYRGRVTLFRTRAHSLFCSYDHAHGWREYAGSVTVRIAPGAHESILEEPHAATVAQLLQQSLSEIQTNQPSENTP